MGSVLVRRLAGHALILPSRDPAGLKAAGWTGEFPAFTEDLESLAAAARPDAVINLLGIIREGPGASFGLVHGEYTRRLLAGARRAGCRKFVQMSALGAAPEAPSEYHRSKFAGEEAVRASGLSWVIFRPSYITGEGQRLRAELRALARFTPVFAAPSDSCAAPVDVGTVAECFALAAVDASVRDELFELGGGRTMSFRDLLAAELAAAGVRRSVIGLPRRLFYPLLPFFSLLNPPPMTREQYLMLASQNVPSGRYPGAEELLRREGEGRS